MFQIASTAVPHNETSVSESFERDGVEIPDYLEEYYWWAYVRPWAVRIFERDWLINLILWGFYPKLRDLVLSMMGGDLFGRTLKISCCYGKLEPMLAEKVAKAGGVLDILDVAPEQLKNSRRKLDPELLDRTVRHIHADSTDLPLPDRAYDRALIFFLPHEQPEHLRRKTFEEAFRVLKPGRPLYVVEFARSRWWHPLRYIWYPVLLVLEPFARDIWTKDLAVYLPHGGLGCRIETTRLFGDFYQCLKITTPKL